ncbi:DNA translocase FtsK [Ignatzschineria cameli]|uniref:DNA translocase FtsK n=2 Tax=Bacteria TaxID=2 RepID=A0A2U2AKF4_9GAMM|nr:DNA translocase FtsK [Ignatzschineria cameli]PWD83347.1 hypothetical protein DC077_10040 [Ignatzschineria cameli]PWD88373.1 hypothetical protein DC079_09885 [Ignatzschineria cameli]PWD88832.1 hypothetical protein DC081_10140 [Ignatzschineria cameli]PWD89339.1 hypothetical protein DC078_09915 [Ignatzschineria cameli]
MRQVVPKKPKASTLFLTAFSKTVGIVLFIATLIIALAMSLSFYSYHPDDPAWSSATTAETVHNIMGERGAYFADIILSAIGSTAWLLPLFLIGFGYQLFLKRKILTVTLDKISFRLLGVLITIFSLSALLDLHSGNGGMMGGFIGTELINILSTAFSIDPELLTYGTKILFAILTFVGFYLVTGAGPIGWMDACGAFILMLWFSIFPQKEQIETHTAALPDHDGNIEQETIDRMLNETEGRKAPNFFNKIFAGADEAEKEKHPDFIEIDESLLKEESFENYESNANLSTSSKAPIKEDDLSSYHYQPLEEENQPTEDTDEMKTTQNTIPPIFRNLKKNHNEPETVESTPVEERADKLDINALEPKLDEVWDDFIRAPQPREEAILEEAPEESVEEKKSIPSIFRNLFKARRKTEKVEEDLPVKVEPSLEAFQSSDNSPSIATAQADESDAIYRSDFDTDMATDLDHSAEESENQMSSYQNGSNPLAITPLQFAITDPTIAQDETDHPSAQTKTEIEPLDLTFGDFEEEQNIDEEDEEELVEVITPAFETQNEASPVAESNKARYIGHEIDPKSGMPIPVKAPKEFPMAGRLPGLDLLGNPPPVTESYDEAELAELASLIEEQFKHFNIEVSVVNIEPGPVITRFELDLAPGVKIAQINNLNKDIARALSVTSVRIVDIIPGKPYIGLEIPNKKRQIVYFKEGLYADAYRNSKHPLTILLGKDVSGNQVVANLVKMPHLLIAGTTGSGKSVGLNTILLSLLYKAHPEDLRLILIDPKMLELSVYDNIPHLLAPVVTDMKESANALRWAVMEMERRYLLMSKLRVRNIDGFNQKVKEAIAADTPIADPLWDPAREVSDHATAPLLKPLPYIVIVIDELADMMMSVGKAVEELIARLTQKARAAGIHMVVATQRPSVDVITGLIKANIPSRIAFQVSSKIDSRTVLDQQGAENLLGHGDMLFFPTGAPFPQRVHGAFVDDNEVNRVTDFLRLTGDTDYVEDILKDPTEEIPGLSENASGYVASPDDVEDVLYDEAVKIVLEDQRPTISYVQRKLRIGYQRAARLIEAMEEQGIISAPAANGNREILIHYEK